MPKSKKALAGIFTCVIFFMLFFIVFARIGQHVEIRENKANIEENSIKAVNWDGREEYSFNNDSQNQESPKHRKLYKRIEDRFCTVRDKIEDISSSGFKHQTHFVLLRNNFQKAIGMDMTTTLCAGRNDLNSSSDVVVPFGENTGSLGVIMDETDITNNISRLVNFGHYTENLGINWMFFLTPDKNNTVGIYKDYSNEKKNQVINTLYNENLHYINFEEYMPVDIAEYAEMFYKTDHHWLPSSGIFANKILCEYLNENFGYKLDTSIFNEDNYRAEKVPQKFLGSYGIKVTEVYCEADDFIIYHPLFDCDLDVYNSRYDTNMRGNIEETLFDYTVFNNEDLYKRTNYAFYGYGDMAYLSIHNNNINDDSHILLIKKSFADCMVPYLAAVFEDMDVIDPRHFNGSIKSFIEKNKPDTVVVIYGIGGFEGEDDVKNLFDFH